MPLYILVWTTAYVFKHLGKERNSTYWKPSLCQQSVLLSLSGQDCDPLTSETHLQDWTKFNTEQCIIYVLLHTTSPTHLQPNCYIRIFFGIQSKPRVAVWTWFKEYYLSFSWRWIIILLKGPYFLCQLILGWEVVSARPKGNLICTQIKESLFCPFESRTQTQNWLWSIRATEIEVSAKSPVLICHLRTIHRWRQDLLWKPREPAPFWEQFCSFLSFRYTFLSVALHKC